jgi:predicted transposase/invertase (TIGR01784 family)
MLYFAGMVKIHDIWYKKLFTNPRIVEDLLTAFVKERFVQCLDFSSIKKLNTSFVSEEFKNRESDVIYEIKSHGKTNYIYLLIEFQSNVDRFMALRMASYVFQFHQEVQDTTKCKDLQPLFPILLYNGDKPWNAPETFRELLSPSEIPEKYLPDFRYYKIAINEIPKRHLVKLRNALATVFYIENSTPREIEQNHEELIGLLKGIFAKEGALLVDSIVKWMRSAQKIKLKSKRIKNIQDLMEVSTMWETAVKKHEDALLHKGIEKGMMLKNQHILIDLLTIKFGKSDAVEKKVTSVRNSTKLEAALRTILSAQSKEEVLKRLD